MEAVRAGNKHKVASLLSMGADPNVFPPGVRANVTLARHNNRSVTLRCLSLH